MLLERVGNLAELFVSSAPRVPALPAQSGELPKFESALEDMGLCGVSLLVSNIRLSTDKSSPPRSISCLKRTAATTSSTSLGERFFWR